MTSPDRHRQPHELADDHLDTLLNTLSIARRRRILRHLVDLSEPIAVDELAGEIAKSEQSVEARPSSTISDDTIEARLYHVDLPKLSEAGLIHHNSARETVQLTELAESSWVRVLIRATSSGKQRDQRETR